MCIIEEDGSLRYYFRFDQKDDTVPNITIDAAQLQALLDTVKSQSEALERVRRSEAEQIARMLPSRREPSAPAFSQHRRRFRSRNRGRAFQSEWDTAYENLGRIAPAMRDNETAEAYRLRLASGVQNCSPDHRDLDLETVLFRQPASFRETILSQIRQDAIKPEARITEIGPGQIREFVRKDEGGRTIHEFASRDGTTFIQQMARPRQIITQFFGRDRIGNFSAKPVEKPQYMGRMALRGGLPPQRLNPPDLSFSGSNGIIGWSITPTTLKATPPQALGVDADPLQLEKCGRSLLHRTRGRASQRVRLGHHTQRGAHQAVGGSEVASFPLWTAGGLFLLGIRHVASDNHGE